MSLFSQKSTGVPRGMESQAEDANPSDQSGFSARIVKPVWKQFVDNEAYQESSRGAVQAEMNMQRQAARSRPAASLDDATEKWGGTGGRLFRKFGGKTEEVDPEKAADHPVAGPFARKALWERELDKTKREASDYDLSLQNPAFHARALAKKDREDMLAEGSVLPETDPRHAELKQRLIEADAYEAEKQDISQKAWNAKVRARQLESTDPETWWQSRSQQAPPSAAEQRAATVQTAKAQQQEADAAEQSAIQEAAEIRAKKAQGMTAAEMDAANARLADIGQAQAKANEVKQGASEQVAQVQQQAAAEVPKEGIGDFVRGAQVSVAQIPQLAYGVAGLVGATAEEFTGMGKGLKDWGLRGYEHSSKAAEPLSRDTDDVGKAWSKAKEGDIGALVDWAQYGIGYALGQIGETLAISALGGAAGAAAGAETGPGAAVTGGVGAVAAGVAKTEAKALAKSMIEKLVAKEAMKLAEKQGAKLGVEEVAKLAASSEMKTAAAKSLGSNAAVMANALGMELGSIYPEAAKQAQIEGREMNGADIARVWGMGIAAGGLEGLTDKLGIDLLKGKFASALPANRFAAASIGGLGDAAVEGSTELAQTFLERLGSRQSVTDEEAQGDYLNSAALGALGGGVVGGVGGAWNSAKEKPEVKTKIEDHVNTALTALDPQAAPLSPDEMAKAALFGRPGDGPQEYAEGVLIERELAQFEQEDADARASAEQAVLDATATGDKTAIKTAETFRDSLGAGRADTTRAVLKIAAGQNLDDLTAAELAAVGMEESGDSFKQIKDAPVMIRAGADGSYILTDGALKAVESVSPRARARVKLSEAEAIQKAKQRAAQPIPETPVAPETVSGVQEFDVPMRDGTMLRVQALDADTALREAAAVAPITGQPATPISPPQTNDSQTSVPSAQENPESRPGPSAKPQFPMEAENGNVAGEIKIGPDDPIIDGSVQGSQSIASQKKDPGGNGGGNILLDEQGLTDQGGDPSIARPSGTASATKPGIRALAKANSTFSKAKKKLGDRLTKGSDRAVATPDRITINPKQIIEQAIARGMNDDQAAEYFDRVLDEEVRHLAQYDAAKILFNSAGKPGGPENFDAWMQTHYAGIWQSDFVATGKADTVRDIYARTETGFAARWETMSDADKALEAIRMMSQGDAITEQGKLWTQISKTLEKALRAALASLKQFAEIASPTLKTEIKNLENALRALTSDQSRPRSPKTDPAKPSQGGSSAGATRGRAGSGEAASDGKVQPGGGAEARSPLEVGQRVEFTGPNGVVQGTIANLAPAGKPPILSKVGPDGVERVLVKIARGTTGVPLSDVKVLDVAPTDAKQATTKETANVDEANFANTINPRDRNQFPGTDYPVPPNVIAFQPRGLDTEPLTDRVWTFSYDGTAEDAARVGAMAFTDLDARFDNMSQRESVIIGSGPDGMAKFRLEMDSVHGKVKVTTIGKEATAAKPELTATAIPDSTPEAPADIKSVPYDDLVRASYAGQEARRKLSDLRPTIERRASQFHATGQPRDQKSVVQWLASVGTVGNVGQEVKEILAAVKLLDAVAFEKESIVELNRRASAQVQVATPSKSKKKSAPSASDASKLSEGDKKALDVIQGLFAAELPETRDADYLAAVKRGDTKSAQRMVDEAAFAAGYNIGPIHHGTLPSRGDFDVFRNGITAKDAFRLNFDGLGPGWFSSDREQASKMGSRVISGYINLKKPLTLYADEFALDEHIKRRKEWMALTKKDRDESHSDPVKGWWIDGLTWDERNRLKELTQQGAGNEVIRGDSFEALERLGKEAKIEFPDLSEGEAIRSGLQAQGYDGIILEATNADSGIAPAARLWVVPFDGGNQIKSADPVTYDQNGNVIPLSQRFNPTSDSILYAAELPETFARLIPPDRFMKLMDAANTWFSEGVTTPEKLADKLEGLAPERKAVVFSQPFWYALKAAGAEGDSDPDWAGIYASRNQDAKDEGQPVRTDAGAGNAGVGGGEVAAEAVQEIDRRGIKRRLASFTVDVENLREVLGVSRAIAERTWQSKRDGLLQDPVLNDEEKQRLIRLGDSIIQGAASPAVDKESLTTETAPAVETITPAPAVTKAAKKTVRKSATDVKKLKAQKEYLLAALDKAIEEAPDTKDVGSWDSEQAQEDAATAESSSNVAVMEALFKKYGVTPNTDKPLTWYDNRQALRNAIYEKHFTPPTTAKIIEIEVPGDGTFRVVNDKTTLKDFRKKANTRFPTNSGAASFPTSTTPNATAIAKIGSPATNKEFVAIAGMFASEDPKREVLQVVHSDGENVVATNGRQILVLKRKIAGSEEKPIHFDAKTQKPVKLNGVYPPWKQVVPREFNQQVEIDTAAVQKIVIQAKAVAGKEQNQRMLMIWRDDAGKMGYTLDNPDAGMFAGGEANPETANPVTAMSVFMLLDGLKAMRMLGHERVTMKVSDLATVLEADGAQYVQAAMKSDAEFHPLSEAGEKAQAEKDAYEERKAEARRQTLEEEEKAKAAENATAPSGRSADDVSREQYEGRLASFRNGNTSNGLVIDAARRGKYLGFDADQVYKDLIDNGVPVNGAAYAVETINTGWERPAAKPETPVTAGKPNVAQAGEAIKRAYPYMTVKNASEERKFITKAKANLEKLGIKGWQFDSTIESAKTEKARNSNGRIVFMNGGHILRQLLKDGYITQEETTAPSKAEEAPRPAMTQSKPGEVEYRGMTITKSEGTQVGYQTTKGRGKGRKSSGYEIADEDGKTIKFVSTLKEAKAYVDQYVGDAVPSTEASTTAEKAPSVAEGRKVITLANLDKSSDAELLAAADSVIQGRKSFASKNPEFGAYKDDAKASRFKKERTRTNAVGLVFDALKALTSLKEKAEIVIGQKSLAELEVEREKVRAANQWANMQTRGSNRPAPPDARALDAEIAAAKEREGKAFWQKTKEQVRASENMPEKKHRQYVEAALKMGKDVPVNVLADYPDLAKPAGKIEDFGEKIIGARKDTWGKFKSAIGQELPEDAADITVSKYFPEPDYEAATANGVGSDALATYRAIRDSIPPKPRMSYKLRRWADMVRGIHPLMQKLASGSDLTTAEYEAMNKLFYRGGDLADKINLYKDLGYPAFTKADDWKIIGGVSMLTENGVRLEKPVIVTAALIKGRFVSGMTSKETGRKGYIEVLDMVRDRITKEMESPTKKAAKPMEFSILSDRRTSDVFIGRKALNGWVRLKTGFQDVKQARQFLADNQAALEEQWEGLKKPVDYRKQVNEPREGPTRREGDVTPEQFQDAFGFRGVQFGNWVEGDRRQVDMNEAFDAFMDLAEALGIPPKAVSLDGSLGLAFGARGIPNAKAHYEPGEVVINLTKKTGPGSLGHEWFHAFDNYFARLDRTGETKAQPLDKFATDSSPAPKNMRPEVWEAFKKIKAALSTGTFAERSKKLDEIKSKAYYSTTIEKAARAFKRYTVDRLAGMEISNDFLVNLTKDESPALPTAKEMDEGIRQAYDELFNVLDAVPTDKGMSLRAAELPADQSSLSGGQQPQEAADSPYHVFGKYRRAESSELIQWERSAIRNAERLAGRGNVSGVRFAQADPGPESRQFLQSLFSLFRKRVAFVSPIAGELPFDGMVHPDDLNTLIIDAESRQGVSYLVGHELGHSIQHQQPELYDSFKSELLAMAKDWSDYDARLARVKDYDTKEKRDAEFVNDFIGSQFAEPKFWRMLHDRNPSIYRKMLDATLEFLASLGSKIGALNRDVRPYFDNIEAAREVLAKTLEEYRNGKMPDASVRKDLKDSPGPLLAADPPESAPEDLTTFKKRGRKAFESARPYIEEAERQMKAFGAGSMGVDPKFANFGGKNQDSRNQVDIVRAYDTFAREIRADRDTFAKAKELLAKDPAGVEELAMSAFGEGKPAISDHEQLAIEMFIQKRLAETGDNRQAQIDNFVLIQANILNRREAARTLRIGFDKFMSPEERARQQLADAIFRLNPKVEARAKTMTLAERKGFLAEAGSARIAEVEKELKKLGLRISQVIGKNRALQLENSRLMKETLKTRDLMDQKILRMVQKGASILEIRRLYGKDAAEKAQAITDNARAELSEKIRKMMAAGMSRDQIREAMKEQALNAAPLGGDANAMSPADIDAEIEAMLAEDFGLPAKVPDRPLPSAKPRKAKTEELPSTNPLSSNWARPEFTDGMASYTFDTKDRAGIMERVEIIRGLAGAVGKISGLDGDKRAKAELKLREINSILAKYGTDAAGIFESGRGIESYGFDVTDIAHVAAVARAINAIDADVVDKASEYLYASMLSGLQTMLVNATAIVPAVWESTVGRGINMAINSTLRAVKLDSAMAEQVGESKYILKALAPALSRAMSNFQASMAAQHPMFDRDVNAMEVDWDKILGGGSHRMIGSISGRKGDIIRLPMRLLTATDDFNRTLLACVEVGTFAYRIAKEKGMKPGSPEMDKFIRQEVNTPGSFSYQLASKKASNQIYSNPLPGQRDPHTGKPVPIRDLGDVVGFVAGKITDAVAKEHESIFLKGVAAAFRISFFPFQRTPFNILRKGIRHTLNPFSLFDIGLGVVQNARTTNPDGTTKWEWRITGDSQEAHDRRLHRAELIERMGQQLQGSVLMMLLMATAAGEGDDDDLDKPLVITGSLPFLPSNMAERDARMRSGIGAYRISFRKGDGSERFGFSYGRIEPVATTLSATIDTLKSVKRSFRSGGGSYDAAASALGGFASQASDKTFMRGVGDLISLTKNIVAEPDIKENRKALQFLAGRLAMVVPNIIKQPVREADPQFRERSNGFMEELLYQAAPFGQKPAKVDPYGNKLEKPGTMAGRPLDVTDAGTDKVNPIDRMLIKWADSGAWSKAENPADRKPWFPAPITNAEFKHTKTGKNVKMSSAQLDEYRQLAGRRAAALLKSQNLNMENPTARDIEKAKEAISQARSDMRKALASKFSKP